jgi:hypothetical protein
LQRRASGPARRDPVVDDDHRPPADVDRRLTPPKLADALLDLGRFAVTIDASSSSDTPTRSIVRWFTWIARDRRLGAEHGREQAEPRSVPRESI